MSPPPATEDTALGAAVAAVLDEAGDDAVDASDVVALEELSTGANRRTHRVEVRGRGVVVVQVERPGAGRGLPGDRQAGQLRQQSRSRHEASTWPSS